MSAVYLLIGILIGVAGAVAVLWPRLASSRRSLDAAGEDAALARSRAGLELQRETLASLVAPLSEQLAVLDRERVRSASVLGEQIRSLSAAQESLRSQTGALVSVLRSSNSRGQWGQMQLRRVVELAGMVNHCDFTEQVSLSGDDGRSLRPDLVVSLPGGGQVLVDAKAPMQALLDAFESEDEAVRASLMAEHARILRRHVRELSAKSYWRELASAPDFVVMFLGGEQLYAAAYEADPELIEDAMAARVLIVTPTTLMALLQTVAFGWRQEQVAQSAAQVAELGRTLYGRLAKFAEHLGGVGVRLERTVSAYNQAVGSFDARVLPGARRLAEHGAGSGEELAALEQLAITARVLVGPELGSEAGLAAEAGCGLVPGPTGE